jgi:hypothetical protein
MPRVVELALRGEVRRIDAADVSDDVIDYYLDELSEHGWLLLECGCIVRLAEQLPSAPPQR